MLCTPAAAEEQSHERAVRALVGPEGGANETLGALFALCSEDPVCAARFYISGSTAFARFSRLFVNHALQPESPFRVPARGNTLTLGEFSDADAAWWLRLMRTMHACTDNEVWLQDHGCVCRPGRVCHAIDAAAHQWELGTTRAAVVLAIVVIVVGIGLIYFQQRATREELCRVGGMHPRGRVYTGTAQADHGTGFLHADGHEIAAEVFSHGS